MKPLLVHCHIFYKEMYPEIKSYLLNLEGYDFDLRVTMVEKDVAICDDLKKSFKNVNVYQVENLGFDVAPFVYVLNQVNLNDYSYVIKLHTKRDFLDPSFKNHFYYGAGWRNLLTSFIKDKAVFKQVIDTLESHPSIGLSGNLKLIYNQKIDNEDVVTRFKAYLQDHNLQYADYRYISGTMFVVRASALEPLKSLNLQTKDFEEPDLTHSKCQLAHVIERFIGYAVTVSGMTVKDCSIALIRTDLIMMDIAINQVVPVNHLCTLFFKEFLWKKVITKYLISVRKTKSNKLLVKILLIPVFSKKL